MTHYVDPARALAERVVTPRPDCLIWTGATDRGYGRISVDGVVQRVHRVAWELANGPIPDGLTIDHLCHVKACVNVEHLELVSHGENASRGIRDFLARKRQAYPRPQRTHCAEGHPLTAENVLINEFTDPGYRRCLTCERARQTAISRGRRSSA